MDNYLNKTSLRFMFVFIAIIACTVGLMELLSRIEGGEGDADSQRAESAETGEIGSGYTDNETSE